MWSPAQWTLDGCSSELQVPVPVLTYFISCLLCCEYGMIYFRSGYDLLEFRIRILPMLFKQIWKRKRKKYIGSGEKVLIWPDPDSQVTTLDSCTEDSIVAVVDITESSVAAVLLTLSCYPLCCHLISWDSRGFSSIFVLVFSASLFKYHAVNRWGTHWRVAQCHQLYEKNHLTSRPQRCAVSHKSWHRRSTTMPGFSIWNSCDFLKAVVNLPFI